MARPVSSTEYPIIAYGITIDDMGMIRQFIGRAHADADVLLIHEQAKAGSRDLWNRFSMKSTRLKTITGDTSLDGGACWMNQSGSGMLPR